MKLPLLLASGLLLGLAPPADASPRPFNADDMVMLDRVSEPALSPDGNHLVFTLRSTDLENNKSKRDIWFMHLDSQEPTRFTKDKASDSAPQWSKDGKEIYFLSSRSGTSQVWKKTINNGEAKQVTDLPVGIDTYKISPTNKHLIFSTRVYPECEDLQCTANKNKAAEKNKATGQVYDKLFMRHWDHWLDGTLSQLFSIPLDGDKANDKKVVHLSRSVMGNVPSSPFGGSEEYTFSADGKQVFFTARIADNKEPVSTNFDIYQASVNGKDKPKNLTKQNPAWDTHPVVSPDGKKLAYLAMKRPGFEADKFSVVVRDLRSGKENILTDRWDRSFADLHWAADSEHLYLSGNHIGKRVMWKINTKNAQHVQLTDQGFVGAMSVADGKVVFAKDDLKSPADFFLLTEADNRIKRLTHVNRDTMKELQMGDYEQFKFKGWNDETVHGYVIKPYNYEEGKKYPVAFLIHGGPQGSFGDHFHYRWNPQTYAGQGYAAVMIDFHGSTGYGQKFTDSISGDWGGKPLEDLQKGLAYATKTYDFLDGNKVCALGASYGGYMINWIAGNWSDRFNCLVNHDGIFDNRMMYYTTEELWFPEWEHGGPYYENEETFEKHNPVNYVENWKTPMMVIQGALDYRVPETQAIATFTALQRRGVESRFLYFPDENHWVLKPQNSIQWHNEVNKWLDKYLN